MNTSRKSDFKTFAGSVRRIYAANSWKSQWELFLLHDRWDEIAGEKISSVTRPAFFRKNTLYIYVENSSWMQQVHFLTMDMVQKVNTLLRDKQIDGVRLLLKPWETPLAHEQAANPVDRDVDPTACREMKQLMEYIEDEDCREALYNLWYCSRSRSRNT